MKEMMIVWMILIVIGIISWWFVENSPKHKNKKWWQNMKKYLILLALLLCVSFVSAATKDIRIMNVENCYNLTVRYELSDGEPVGVKFYGCKDWGNQTWFCNCRSDLNSYNLVMQTDSAIVREAREYELEVTGYVYS